MIHLPVSLYSNSPWINYLYLQSLSLPLLFFLECIPSRLSTYSLKLLLSGVQVTSTLLNPVVSSWLTWSDSNIWHTGLPPTFLEHFSFLGFQNVIPSCCCFPSLSLLFLYSLSFFWLLNIGPPSAYSLVLLFSVSIWSILRVSSSLIHSSGLNTLICQLPSLTL